MITCHRSAYYKLFQAMGNQMPRLFQLSYETQQGNVENVCSICFHFIMMDKSCRSLIQIREDCEISLFVTISICCSLVNVQCNGVMNSSWQANVCAISS